MSSFSKRATAVMIPLTLALGGAGCMAQPADEDAVAAPEATSDAAQADCSGGVCTPTGGRPPVFGHPPVHPPHGYPPPPVHGPRGHGYPPHGYPPHGWNDGYPPRGWNDGYPPSSDGWGYYGAPLNHGPVLPLPSNGLPPFGAGHGPGDHDH
jgi:hypothetical protein